MHLHLLFLYARLYFWVSLFGQEVTLLNAFNRHFRAYVRYLRLLPAVEVVIFVMVGRSQLDAVAILDRRCRVDTVESYPGISPAVHRFSLWLLIVLLLQYQIVAVTFDPRHFISKIREG